jgi:hypothetical protein
MQCGSVFRDVDVVASKHGIDSVSQIGLVRQLQQKLESLVGNTILRVIEINADSFGSEALSSFRIIRKQVAEVHFLERPIMRLQGLPRRPLCGRDDEVFVYEWLHVLTQIRLRLNWPS